MKKEYFINAVQMVEVDGSTNVPTVLFYDRSGRILVGSAALAEGRAEDLNEDFKVDLGNIDPESKTPRTPFFTSGGIPKSAADLTGDFMHDLTKSVHRWLAQVGLNGPTSILVAEPLALASKVVSDGWVRDIKVLVRRPDALPSNSQSGG